LPCCGKSTPPSSLNLPAADDGPTRRELRPDESLEPRE
jgi:hypothetical protein